jgi:hypothetical protein
MKNFTDHLNFGPNIFDNIFVRKNLAEANLRGPEELRKIGLEKAVEASKQRVDAVYANPRLGQSPNAKDIAFASGMVAGREAQKPYNEQADIRHQQIIAALNMIPEAAYFGDHDAVQGLTRVISAMHGVQHSLGDPTVADYRLFAAVHAGDYQPRRPEPEDFQQSEPAQPSQGDMDMLRRMTDRGPILRGRDTQIP